MCGDRGWWTGRPSVGGLIPKRANPRQVRPSQEVGPWRTRQRMAMTRMVTTTLDAAARADDLVLARDAGHRPRRMEREHLTMHVDAMRQPAPSLIRIFLAHGKPDGLWVVDKPNWTGVALAFPRAVYSSVRMRDELSRAGVYVL